jgi:hypothetical protein
MKKAHWKVNTPSLLRELVTVNNLGQGSVAVRILGLLLAEITERAIELNDPKLNALMCRASLYEESDPYSPSYDKQQIEETITKFF